VRVKADQANDSLFLARLTQQTLQIELIYELPLPIVDKRAAHHLGRVASSFLYKTAPQLHQSFIYLCHFGNTANK
jgi:hypothetical protein